MFWGLIMEPGRCYTQKVKVPFHISMASMDISNSSDDPAQVMCVYENRNYLLCTLNKKSQVQVNLDLNFSANTKVSFATNGNSHIHLTGYLNVEEEDEVDDESEEEVSDSEALVELRKGTLKRLNSNSNGPASKKMKKSSTAGSSTATTITKSPVSRTLAEALNGEDLDEDENDSDFVLSREEASEDEFVASDISDDDDDDMAEDDDNDEDAGEKDEDDSDMESDVSELSMDSTETEDETDDDDVEKEIVAKSPKKLNTSAKAKQQQQQQQQQQQKKKTPTPAKEVKTTPKAKLDESANSKQNKSPKTKKKMVKGGVMIEDIKEGQGEPAVEGKSVTVYYEGSLKNSGKVFDSHKQGKGLIWRLGDKTVIRGMDIGVKGMKAGGERRITIPAALAYGPKGDLPTIPPNAPLVFWVNMKRVK